MKPKKYKEILKDLQKKHNWNEELAADAVSFFYSRVRKALVNLEDTNVFLPKLGTFRIRPVKMKTMIEEKERLVEKLNPHVFNKYDSFRKHSTDLEKLYNVKNKLDELDQKRSEFRKDQNSKD